MVLMVRVLDAMLFIQSLNIKGMIVKTENITIQLIILILLKTVKNVRKSKNDLLPLGKNILAI